MKHVIKIVLNILPRQYLHYIAHFFLRLLSPFYRGDTFEDPITGIKYKKLLPYGRVNMRKNALAPDSMSLERHRLFWLYLKHKTDFFSAHLKVLHLAPEYCFIKRFREMKNIDYTTGDLNSPWADVKIDVHKMPFSDNSFDVVFANHLLEHVENDIKAMGELYRVLTPNGWGIFMVPLDSNRKKTYENPRITDPKEREKHFGQCDHVRTYGLDYPERLSRAGFEVREDNFIDTISPESISRYCLPRGERIYLCTKP